MAHFPADLRTLIAATTPITALVSTRIHYNTLPQSSAMPHLWFRVSRDTEARTLDGVGGMHEADVDIECVGLTETSAQDVADAVKTKLDGYKGSSGSSTISAAFLSDKSDDYQPFSIPADQGVHVIAFGLHCWYRT